MANAAQLIAVHLDTQKWCREDKKLSESIQASTAGTRLYREEEYPALPQAEKSGGAAVAVTRERTFEAALRLCGEVPGARIAVHNFASAVNPGGGVTVGSQAQEECLCRCSTLYPVLCSPSLKETYYQYHKKLHNLRYTDACIYSPGIWIIKTDTKVPERMPESAWRQVDVLTCAAPNLRVIPYNVPGSTLLSGVNDQELLEIHKKRARHMLTIAAAHGAEVLVLGAFGCGAFGNKPEIVAKAYKEIVAELGVYFKRIEFAVYSSYRDSRNYDAFKEILEG